MKYGLLSLLPLLTALAIETFISLQASASQVSNAPLPLEETVISFINAVIKSLLTPRFWLLASALTLIYLIHLAYQRKFKQQARARWWHLFGTLDGVLIVVLIAWTLGMTGIFVYNPDPMRNQPLEPVLDAELIIQQWKLSLYYFWQFLVMAAVVFFYYWMNRYQFIRKVLQQHGVYVYLLCSILWLILTYPLFALLILKLPLNIPEQTLLPSEDHNIFAGMNLLVSVVIWALSTPLILAFEQQQSAKEMAELKQGQIQAELKMLQQQVNPHFLFNTLNSLYALCLKGSTNAAPMVLILSDLLRYIVYQGQNPKVLLSEELTYLHNYIKLQQIRLGDRCKITWTNKIEDKNAIIAPLLLIMLLENAFKHGVEKNFGTSTIEISVWLKGDQFGFLCTNNLAEMTNKVEPNGIGLSNLRRRLQLAYPGRHHLHSEQRGSHWFAELRITL